MVCMLCVALCCVWWWFALCICCDCDACILHTPNQHLSFYLSWWLWAPSRTRRGKFTRYWLHVHLFTQLTSLQRLNVSLNKLSNNIFQFICSPFLCSLLSFIRYVCVVKVVIIYCCIVVVIVSLSLLVIV